MPVFTVDSEIDLRSFLQAVLPGWKISTLRRRLEAGLILLDGSRAGRFSQLLSPGQELRVLSAPDAPPVPGGVFPPGLGCPPLTILHSDSLIIAVDKPAGLLSVATEREKKLTAVRLMRDWLAAAPENSGAGELHAAHRLDRDASGVLLLARSLEVRGRLVREWRDFSKIYLAVVDGAPPRPEGSVSLPLREDRGLFVRAAANRGGREAVTHYRLLRRVRGGRSLLEVRLETGRKHQIRAHLAHLGCPVAGDRRYGVSKAPRLALHASLLELSHPGDGRRLRIQSPLPPDLAAIIHADHGPK